MTTTNPEAAKSPVWQDNKVSTTARIDAVAIKAPNGIVLTLPKPARHHDILHSLADLGCVVRGATQGFLTSEGKFVDRTEAWSIALAADQIFRDHHIKGKLFSEHVW